VVDVQDVDTTEQVRTERCRVQDGRPRWPAKRRGGEATAASHAPMEPGKRGIRAYFDVDDINAGATRVRELGGQANEPGPVPGMGWFAVCRDTEGNEFGLWQNDPSAPAPTG
jgi:predicted enzyme related to lactoylglutathione lyase